MQRSSIEAAKKAPAEARLLTIPVLALYTYLILDTFPPVTESDRIVLYLFVGVMAVILFGSIGVRLQAAGMFYIFLIAAILQTFAFMTMFVSRWRSLEAIFFLNSLLILSHLFIAWRFRRAARTNA